ncbi:MAG TPA: PAS domain S-box protein [Candidatus Acidoferrales bacterium]|nr:PAS domain S-box protein [Candidatus Acidoferrales bacterium]
MSKRSSQSEDLYHTLFEQAADGIFVSDEKGRYVEVNQRSCEMLGYSREEILQRCTDDFTLEEERRQSPVKLDDLLVGQKIAFERNLICKGDRLLPVEINVRKLSNGNHLAIIRDITERKQAELAITQVLEWQEAIFEGSRDAVFISNLQSQFIAVNKAACELTGYTTEELLAMSIPDLHDGADLKAYNEFHERIMAGEAASTEAKIRRKDGTKVDTEFSNNRVSIAGIIFMHTVARDITERKKAEGTLRKEEEKRLQLERQLIQSQKFEELGALASGIAHDFNNILNVIMGHSSLLKDHISEPDRIARSIEAIEKASERGASVVKQLLTLARKNETVFESIRVNDVVAEICRLLQETLPKRIVVSTNLQRDLPSITADANQLHQIFMNLCVNARDAMPRGGTITISTSTIPSEKIDSKFPRAGEKEYLMVQVSDTGIGMSEEIKRRIFEPFFTTKAPGKGTGLGLALVYSIIENHHGMIEVESEPGRGTTFSIYFPVDERKDATSQGGSPSLAEITGGNETILVIEDEEMLRDLLNTILIAKGYSVLTASDGEEGVAVFKKYKGEISTVITDLGLPKLSGDDVVKQIKSVNPNSKIILSSGFLDEGSKAELLQAGAKCFILKPYKPAEVLQTVRRVIDAKE